MAHQTTHESITCTDCGTQFNLAAQSYYTNRCPDCEGATHDTVDDTPHASCYVCDEPVSTTEQYYSRKAAPYDVSDKVLVCPAHRDYRWTPNHGL